MIIKIKYSKASEKFIEKNPTVISREKAKKLIIMAIKKILKIEKSNIDLKSLRANYNGSYRIKKACSTKV